MNIVFALALAIPFASAQELCGDGIDNDGNGLIDEGCSITSCTPQDVSASLQLSDSPYDSNWPVIIWNGGDYAVAWRDDKKNAEGIYFMKLDANGNKIFASPKKVGSLTSSTGGWAYPSFVSNGNQYAFVWQDGSNIKFSTADINGNLILEKTITTGETPRITWFGDGYGVVYERSGTAYFMKIDENGNTIVAEKKISGAVTGVSFTEVAWSGTELAAIWQGTNSEIYFVRIMPDGTINGNVVQVSSGKAGSSHPFIVWNGFEYGIVWADGRDPGEKEVYFNRISANGQRLLANDKRVTFTPGKSFFPSISWDGSNYGIIWADQSSGQWQIYFAKIDSNGNQLISDTPLTSGTETKGDRAYLVWNGANFGLTFYRTNNNIDEVFFKQIPCSVACGDNDNDGFSALQCGGADCDDYDPNINPGEAEVCGDGMDQNCDNIDQICNSVSAISDTFAICHSASCAVPCTSNNDCGDPDNPACIEASCQPGCEEGTTLCGDGICRADCTPSPIPVTCVDDGLCDIDENCECTDCNTPPGQRDSCAPGLVCSAAGVCEPNTGTITGTVSCQGTPEINVVVGVLGTALSATTGPGGDYTINNVPGGSRDLVTSKIGYTTERKTIDVNVGETTTADFNNLCPSSLSCNQLPDGTYDGTVGNTNICSQDCIADINIKLWCNNVKKGLAVPHPTEPKKIICCLGPIVDISETATKIKIDADNIARTTRIVYYQGRPVRLTILTWN